VIRKYILHIAKDYSFEILRPLQKEILARGDECVWFVGSSSVDCSRFKDGEVVIKSVDDIANYPSDAVFSPGNNVPNFLKGLKVQVFHGLEWKKKGHFRIRDFFDLYCTHGPITTRKFSELAEQHKNFLVRETGWPKLDPLFSTEPFRFDFDGPTILYAPTFSPSLSSAQACFDEIIKLSHSKSWSWIVKFHPMMDRDMVEKFKAAQHAKLVVVEGSDVLPIMRRADVMLSDTSSVVGEFLLLNKPVVTYRNSLPTEGLINITEVSGLVQAVEYALAMPKELKQSIRNANDELHPYDDSKSSSRVLDAVEDILDNNVKPKKKRPRNILRNFKLNRKLGYKRF